MAIARAGIHPWLLVALPRAVALLDDRNRRKRIIRLENPVRKRILELRRRSNNETAC
jgi:hypothetical protein